MPTDKVYDPSCYEPQIRIWAIICEYGFLRLTASSILLLPDSKVGKKCTALKKLCSGGTPEAPVEPKPERIQIAS